VPFCLPPAARLPRSLPLATLQSQSTVIALPDMLFTVAYSLLALFSTALAAPARRTACEGVVTRDEAKRFSSNNTLTDWSYQDGEFGTFAVLSADCPTTADSKVTVFVVVRREPVWSPVDDSLTTTLQCRTLIRVGQLLPLPPSSLLNSGPPTYDSGVVHQADNGFGTVFECIANRDFTWYTLITIVRHRLNT